MQLIKKLSRKYQYDYLNYCAFVTLFIISGKELVQGQRKFLHDFHIPHMANILMVVRMRGGSLLTEVALHSEFSVKKNGSTWQLDLIVTSIGQLANLNRN